MTPLVDLAFLLLTFFMLTVHLAKDDFVIKVEMPDREEVPQPMVNRKQVITMVLEADNRVYWYGADEQVYVTDFSAAGIRRVLQQKRETVRNLVVLIKPTARARYQNLIDALDEMSINKINRFAIDKITPADEALISNVNK